MENLKYTVIVKDNETGNQSIECKCNALVVGVALEDDAFAFHVSGTHEEMAAIVSAVNREVQRIFEEE